MNTASTNTKKSLDSLPLILLLGSLWGLSEILLNEAVRSLNLPMRAAILTGVGMFLLGAGYFLLNKPSLLFWIPVVAVALKQVGVPLTGMSVMCKANSCIAVLLEGFALAGAAMLLTSKNKKGSFAYMTAGLSAGVISGVAFYFIGLKVAPCNYLRSFAGTTGFISYFIREAMAWGVFSAALFPLGVLTAKKFEAHISDFVNSKPFAYNVSVCTLIALSWLISAIAIVAGI